MVDKGRNGTLRRLWVAARASARERRWGILPACWLVPRRLSGGGGLPAAVAAILHNMIIDHLLAAERSGAASR